MALVAFEVFLLIRVRQGRITLTVLTALGALFTIPSLLLQDGFITVTVTGPVTVVLQAVVVALLFRPAPNQYFAPRR